VLAAQDDSIEGIYSTLKRCAQISKAAGGVGLSVSGIRASGSYIRGTNGQSNGLLPMLRVYNNTARFVNQGGGKRQGSFAMYLEPWHADVFAFLDLKKNHGKEESRARDLFYALWVRRAPRAPRRARRARRAPRRARRARRRPLHALRARRRRRLFDGFHEVQFACTLQAPSP